MTPGCSSVSVRQTARRLMALRPSSAHPSSAGVRPTCGPPGAGAAVWDADQGMAVVACEGFSTPPRAGTPGQQLHPDQLFDLASVTKVCATTALAMVLTSAGELDVNAPISRYLPGPDSPLTVAQLLTHTSGLPAWAPLYLQTQDRGQAVRLAQSAPLVAEPGTRWVYSDLGMIVAGAVLEAICAQGLAQAFARLIAEPLDLALRYGPVSQRDAVCSADSDAYEFAMITTGQPYPVRGATADFTSWRQSPVCGHVNDGNAAHAMQGVAGHAGLFGTLDSVVRLMVALRSGAIGISHEVYDRFMQPSAVNPHQAMGFALGTRLRAGRPHTIAEHGGFTGTYVAFETDGTWAVAGAAMRLVGTVGALHTESTLEDVPALPRLIDSQQIAATIRQTSDAPTAAGVA